MTALLRRAPLTALRRAPLTAALLAALWITGICTGSLVHGPTPALRAEVGIGLPALVAGHWWSVLSSVLWCSGPIAYVLASAVLVLVVAPVEDRLGSRWTACVVALVQPIGLAIGLGIVAAGSLSGDPWSVRLATLNAVGPTPLAAGLLLAASARFDVLWRRRIRIGTVVVLVMPALYSGTLQDVLRLSVGLTGLALGALLFTAERAEPAVRLTSSSAETRVLVALVVAASAVGPLLAVTAGTTIGPLSVLRFLVLSPAPDPAVVQAVCAQGADDCAGLQLHARLRGPGPAVMSIIPVLVLLVLADGLRRGRRFAWWGTVGLNLVFSALGVLLAVLSATTPVERLAAFGGSTDAQFWSGVVVTALQPLAIVVLLLLTADRFAVSAPAGTLVSWTRLVGAAFAATALCYLSAAWVFRTQFTPVPGWADIIADLPTRYLPPGYLGEVEIAFVPVGVGATLVHDWIGVVFWAVAAVATMGVLRRVRTVDGDARAARDLLTRSGGSSLSWLTTWAGNEHWFDSTGRAAVAYRVIGRIALTTGEPFGEPSARGEAIEGFARFCAEHAWTPCLYSVGEDTRDHAPGWLAVQVAEETVVPLPGLAFTGRKWQDVRTALNKAGKAGITAEWITFSRASFVITDQIRAISEEWADDKGLPEMGFTLGGLDELADEEVRCLVAVDTDRTVHGVTSWMPVHEDGEVVAWTLDFMRRRGGGFPGVMEFLIASAATTFQDEGAAYLSLSGAPLARLDRDEQPAALQRLLDVSGRALEPVYGFRSLLAFKAKFQPEYRPLYMLYPDAAALPAIAGAIGRAYLPGLDVTGTVRLLRRLRRAFRSTLATASPADGKIRATR